MFRIKVHERNTTRMGLSDKKLAVVDKLRSDTTDHTGIPGLNNVVGIEVATLDPVPVNWVRNPWYLRINGKEYKNPKWATNKYNEIRANVVNDKRISGIIDDAVTSFISKQFPKATLVTINDMSNNAPMYRLRQPRRYIYDMGDSRLYMVLDVEMASTDHIQDIDDDSKFFVEKVSPAIKCTLYKDEYPLEDKYALDDAYYENRDFNFNKDLPKLQSYIDNVYTISPRRYRYSVFSPLERSQELYQYSVQLKNKLKTWAAKNNVKIDNIINDSDSDDDAVVTLVIDTYNNHYDDINKFLKDSKKNAPGWVSYGIFGLQ